MAAACVVGVFTGAAAIGFVELIRGVQFLAIGAPDLASYIVPWVPWWRVLLAVAAGGFLVAVITRYFASEVRGSDGEKLDAADQLHESDRSRPGEDAYHARRGHGMRLACGIADRAQAAARRVGGARLRCGHHARVPRTTSRTPEALIASSSRRTSGV